LDAGFSRWTLAWRERWSPGRCGTVKLQPLHLKATEDRWAPTIANASTLFCSCCFSRAQSARRFACTGIALTAAKLAAVRAARRSQKGVYGPCSPRALPEACSMVRLRATGIVRPAPLKKRGRDQPMAIVLLNGAGPSLWASASRLSRAELPATYDRGERGRHARFRLSSCVWALRAPPGSPLRMARQCPYRPHHSVNSPLRHAAL
jgi:hypothetical protein